MLQGRCKAAADHVTQDVKNHHVGVFQQVMLFEQLDGLTHHITATACACGRSTGFNAHHTVVAFEHKVIEAKFFGVKVHGFQGINDCWHQFFGQRKRRVVLWVAPNLQHSLAQFAESN